MTIRGRGRPRDPRVQAHEYEADDYAAPMTWQPDPRRGGNGRRTRGGGGGLAGVLRFLVFALVLGGLVLVVALTALRPLVRDAVAGWGYDNPSALCIPFVAGLVRERLGPALTEPATDDASEVVFTVREGDTVSTVASRLADQGLVRDEQAFVFEATMRNLAPDLKSGDFRLAKNMTPEQVVTGLIRNEVTEPQLVIVPQTFRESLRIDQMATLIQTWEDPLTVDAEEFQRLATRPTRALLEDFPWVRTSGRPNGASLEGYLAPATYDITPETTAEDLIRMMLERFANDVGAEELADEGFYDRLTLASIVEREAVLEEERPLIAGAYQNRLDSDGSEQILNADPTVFYALDTVALRDLPFSEWTQYSFWEPPGEPLAEVALPEELEGYNTYRNRGLPPGPICSPSLSSIDAALEPDTEAGFKYFVAIPDGGGEHDFSTTLGEHQEKLRRYGYL